MLLEVRPTQHHNFLRNLSLLLIWTNTRGKGVYASDLSRALLALPQRSAVQVRSASNLSMRRKISRITVEPSYMDINDREISSATKLNFIPQTFLLENFTSFVMNEVQTLTYFQRCPFFQSSILQNPGKYKKIKDAFFLPQSL